MELFKFSLPEEEKPLLILKLSWCAYIVPALKVLFSAILLGFLSIIIWPLWWENGIGRIFLMIILLAMVLYLIGDYWKKLMTTYIITQCRLIDITQEKILRRTVTEIALDEIEEVELKSPNKFYKIFRVFNVVLKLKNKKGTVVFNYIAKAEKAKEIIDSINTEIKDIVEKKGKECNVILKDNKTHNVPLSYSYYGSKEDLMKKEEEKVEETIAEKAPGLEAEGADSEKVEVEVKKEEGGIKIVKRKLKKRIKS